MRILHLSKSLLFFCVLFLNAAYAECCNTSFQPYISARGGISSERIYNVVFQNPREPQLISAVNSDSSPFGSLALGTRVANLPLRIELEGTALSQSQFSRNYFFPSFFSVVGVQLLRIESRQLLVKGYYDFPFRAFTPNFNVGLGAAWNKTRGTQKAPQLENWIHDFVGTTQRNFAWSVGVGFTKNICDKLFFEAGLNYLKLGKFDTGVLPYTGDENILGKLSTYNLLLGLRYYL